MLWCHTGEREVYLTSWQFTLALFNISPGQNMATLTWYHTAAIQLMDYVHFTLNFNIPSLYNSSINSCHFYNALNIISDNKTRKPFTKWSAISIKINYLTSCLGSIEWMYKIICGVWICLTFMLIHYCWS